MPDTIDRDLRDCLERPNPYVETRIEISEPDVGQVLRRQDQFLTAPSLVSQSPANSLAASARGALILTPSTAALATFAGTQSSFDLNPEDPNRRLKGLSWSIDAAFSRAIAKNILAKVQAVALAGFYFDQDFELQIFQIVRTPGVKVKNPGTSQYQATAFVQYSFAPLLTPAPIVRVTAANWGANTVQQLNFDLSNYRLVFENIPTRAVTPDQVGILPKYLIVVRLAGKNIGGNSHYKWLTDTATSHSVSGVGTFDRVFWAKDSDEAQWAETISADVPNITINDESYPASGQGVFLVDLGVVPKAASSGRIEFQRALPSGTAATLELSTAGSGGPWTAVKHGDAVSIKQQQYHLRATLTSDTPHRATPEVLALGLEFRTPIDVSVEGIASLPTREVSLPWPLASIPEGRVKVVRTGVKDYLDFATVLGSSGATPRLEADIFLASRHPSVTRDKWLRQERMLVSNRLPSATSEDFTLLSYASRLKRKVPQKAETINSVHVVSASTTAQVTVNGAQPLPGTTIGGNEYDGKNYYMRVRSTAASNIPVGFVAVIQGNTDTTKLDFTPALPQALVAGDVIEVHSGIFQTQAVQWADYDPADVWWEILTNLLSIPPERIGLGTLPRGGRPPKVTDIAPGDATTQAKRKVTQRVSEEVEGEKLLAQVSAILGGVTIEVRGQIVFVQLIPLTDVSGNVTVPLPNAAQVFDLRDYAAPPSTPLGLESRATIVTAKYGVPATAAQPESFPSKATTAVDADALLFLSQQDLEDRGTRDVPDEIASWLYNTTDQGLYLASVITAQMVRAISTGLRVFNFRMAEKHPTLLPGDVIICAVDSYTDFDPATQLPIKGPLTIRGVLVRVGSEGRDLSIFVPGLRDNVQMVKGGAAGTLPGLGTQPAPPVLSASFDAAGHIIINSAGDFATASQKIAYGSGAVPSAATVRAQAPANQQLVSGLISVTAYAPGDTVYVAAFAYSANGLESTPLAVISVTREGAGVSAPPIALITPLNGDVDDLSWNLRFEAVAGSGGGGANLTYDVRVKIGFAAESSIASGNGTTLPRDLNIARHPRSTKAIRFIVTDTATGLNSVARYTVPSARSEITDAGDQFTSGVKESGGKPINRMFAKPLSTSSDDADSVLAGLQRRIPLLGATDSSGNADLSGTAWVNKHAGNLPKRSPSQGGTWSASGVTLVGSAALVNDGNAVNNAFHTDSAVAGAYVQVDMGVATTFDILRIYEATVGSNASWKVRHSPDAAVWTDAITGFKPSEQGWNIISFTAITRRYWRLELENAPGGGPYVNEVEFVYEQGGDTVSHQRPVPTVRYEDGVTRSITAMENSGNLKATTQQKNGTGLKNIANGRYALGTGTHTQSVTFPTNYQNPPAVNILGGISYQPASLWGTALNADANPQTGTAAPNASAQVDEVMAYNVTAATCSLRARLRQASTSTARTNAYAAGQITSDGGTLEATTANAPAANDTYTTDFTAQFTSIAVPGKSCSVSGTVCLDWWNGSVWTQVASSTYSASDPVGGSADTGLINDALVATVSGLTATSKFRLRLVTNAGFGSRSYSVDPGNVAYSTTTGDQYTSKTPAALGINLSVEVIGAS